MRELSSYFGKEPALLGPKALHLLVVLSMARDEVNWLLRHQHLHSNDKEWIDEQLAEFLLLIEELRGLFYFRFLFICFLQMLIFFVASFGQRIQPNNKKLLHEAVGWP